MNEKQTQNAPQQQVSQMPKLDYSKLNGLLNSAQGTNTPVQGAQQAQTQQQMPVQGQVVQGSNPDVVSAQEEFKDIKDGDKYTDPNGQEWVWNVMDFVVVPEDVKDKEVDDLTEGGEVSAGEEDSVVEEEEGSDDSEGEEVEESDDETVIVQDEADKILQDAINEVLGIKAKVVIALDGNPYAPDESRITRVPETQPLTRSLTAKRQGYETNDPSEIAKISPTQWKKGRVSVNGVKVNDPSQVKPGQTVKNSSYMVPADKKAMENAHLSHRRHVAATWEKCRAKDKTRCPYHGAAYMTDKLGEIIAAHGIKGAKYGILMHDPEVEQSKGKKDPVQYRILFALPTDVSADVRKAIAKEFFEKNPNILLDSAGARRFGKYENNIVFSGKKPELPDDDLPIDAPTREDVEARHDTAKEQEYNERAKARGAVSWTSFDTLGAFRYFDMLSERPTNIVECNDDMLRYAKQFSEYLPKGLNLEGVQATYDAFMKANAKKKGLQAFLVNGETVDKAEALAAAAEQGLEKEYQAYYDASEKSFQMAQDIFRSVQDALFGEYAKLQQEVYGLPDGRAVIGEQTSGKTSVYFGGKYASKDGTFPLNVGGEDEELLRQAAFDYKNLWNTAARNFDFIQQGCETREPMAVMYGIRRLATTIQAIRDKSDILGEIQDAIIEAQDPRWLKKHGIGVHGAKGGEGDGEMPVDVSAERGDKEGKKKPKSGKAQKRAEEVTAAKADAGEATEIMMASSGAEAAAAEEGKQTSVEEEDKGNSEQEEKEVSAQGDKNEQKQDVSGAKEEVRPQQAVASASEAGRKREDKTRLSEEDTKAVKELAKKNKSFVALNKKRTEMYQAFGEDSEQYKEATAKAKEVLGQIVKDYLASKGLGATEVSAAKETSSTQEARTTKTPEGQLAQGGGESDAETQEKQETQMTSSGAETKGSADTNKGKPQTQGVKRDPAQNSGTSDQRKKEKVAPKSSVVEMARGGSQSGEGASAPKGSSAQGTAGGVKEAQGKGVDIAKRIQIPDKPTLEDAAKINRHLADLEKRIRGLSRVYSASYTDESDYRAAEEEIQGVKAEIDRIVKDARGKGLYWTNDPIKYSETGSSARPLDLPTNFRISSIKGADGQTVNVPYKAPAANEIDMPESKAHATRSAIKEQVAANKMKSSAPFQKKSDYSEDFSALNEKVGAIGSVYGDKTVDDLVFDGFKVSIPFRRKDGTLEWLFGKSDEGDSLGVSRSKENPPIPLSALYAKRFGGDPNDKTALRHFVEAIKAAVKKMPEFD